MNYLYVQKWLPYSLLIFVSYFFSLSFFIAIHKTDKVDGEIRFSIFMLFGFFATYHWLPEDRTTKTLEEWAVGLENKDFQTGLGARVFSKCWKACVWVLSAKWWVSGRRRSLVSSGGEGEGGNDGEARDGSTAVGVALGGVRIDNR